MRILFTLIFALFSTSSIADDDSLAFKLGPVIAAEKFCGLSFDGTKLRNYLTSLVIDDAAYFLNSLDLSIRTSPLDQEKMNDIEKLTHCTLVERSAKELGFLK